MIYLFVHQHFPGQYLHLVRHLAGQSGNSVYFISQPSDAEIPGVRKITYKKAPFGGAGCHAYTVEFDIAVRTGLLVAEACRGLRDQGIQPDLIVGHVGWGETLFIKDVFPDVPLLGNFEFYFHVRGVDVGFDPEFQYVFHNGSHLRSRNAVGLVAFDSVDWGHSATEWQRRLHPPEMRGRITTIHEGVDTKLVKPDRKASFRLEKTGQVLTRADEVVTYVARNLEPYRGFHTMMRALPEILRRRPKAHVLVVGGDGVSYGAPAPPKSSYREMFVAEMGDAVDWTRVHFLGSLQYQSYLKLLQVSSVHIYLTYPFVLSWSFIESLATGCLVVGSSTPPVLEVLEDRVNGLTVDFFSAEEVAERVDEVFRHPDRMQALRNAARKTAVSHFDLNSKLLPRWLKLFDDIVAGRRPDIH